MHKSSNFLKLTIHRNKRSFANSLKLSITQANRYLVSFKLTNLKKFKIRLVRNHANTKSKFFICRHLNRLPYRNKNESTIHYTTNQIINSPIRQRLNSHPSDDLSKNISPSSVGLYIKHRSKLIKIFTPSQNGQIFIYFFFFELNLIINGLKIMK